MSRSPVPPGPLGGNPPGWERSAKRDVALATITLQLKGTPLADAVTAVSQGLLDLQVDSMEALQRGVPHRMMYWLMDDVEKADDFFWKRALAIEQSLAKPSDPAIDDERDAEAERLRPLIEAIEASRSAIQRLRATVRDGEPALKEAQAATGALLKSARQLRRR